MTDEELDAALEAGSTAEPIVEETEEEEEKDTDEKHNEENNDDGDDAKNEGTGNNGSDDDEDASGNKDDALSITTKFRGKDVTIEGEDKIKNLIGRGILQQETSEINNRNKPFMRIINKNGLTPEDIETLADIKSGNESAIEYLTKKYINKDDDDDTAKEYKPNVKSLSPKDDFLEDLSINNKVMHDKYSAFLSDLPEAFVDELEKVDKAIGLFYNDFENGLAEKVIADAITYKYVNGGSYTQAYIKVANEVTEEKNNNDTDSQANMPSSNKKKKIVDVSKMGTEEFDKYIEKFK